jgi:RNA polymerase sigma-70 factor (ECF subfamily)
MVITVTPLTRTAAIAPGQPRRAGDRAPGQIGLGHLDDNALMAAVRVGDAAALDQLYVRYRPVAFAAAYALLRDPNAAEDAVHDAFVHVWRAASSFQPERGSPRAWLLSIVRNTAIDVLRARQIARRRQAALAGIEISLRSEEDVSVTVAMVGDARRLRTALSALPLPQRHAVELAFFGGLSHGEIAERTDVPLGTVKGRIRLGLRRLRHDLSGTVPASRRRGIRERIPPE